mmetsp:Transcript_8440/g.15426  ORF Transcript_8440/g.15426 Transcript_8440/m.15426 type:complete len:216 (-) Transcript_8440:12-659(-)
MRSNSHLHKQQSMCETLPCSRKKFRWTPFLPSTECRRRSKPTPRSQMPWLSLEAGLTRSTKWLPAERSKAFQNITSLMKSPRSCSSGGIPGKVMSAHCPRDLHPWHRLPHRDLILPWCHHKIVRGLLNLRANAQNTRCHFAEVVVGRKACHPQPLRSVHKPLPELLLLWWRSLAVSPVLPPAKREVCAAVQSRPSRCLKADGSTGCRASESTVPK